MKRAAILVTVIIFALGFRPHLARAQASITQEAGGFNILDLAAPPWMHWLGDGSDSSLTVSGTTPPIQGVHYYTSLSVPNSVTLTVGNTESTAGAAQDQPPGAFIAFVQGTCTISGTITADGVQPHNAFLANNGGGSGGGGSSGNAGGPSNLAGGGGVVPIAVGGASGATCSAGTMPTQSAQRLVAQNLLSYGQCGGAAGGGPSGAGGFGGGCIVLICHDLNFTSTGVLTAKGATGGAGGGGGGGGIVITATANLIANNASGISVLGGAGGSGGCAGGNGWLAQYVIQ